MVQTRARKYAVAKKRAGGRSKNPSKRMPSVATCIRITRAMKVNGPRQAVFDTAEILEQIFLNLPRKSLWTCQRVCKQFQAMTKTSPALQEEMMLRPRLQPPRECWKLMSGRKQLASMSQPRPMVDGYFVVQDPSEIIPESETRFKKILWTPATLCPLLKVYMGRHALLKNSAVRLDRNTFGERVTFNCTPEMLSSPGSWKDVLVTDPPCFEACVDLRFIVGHNGIPDGTLKLHRHVTSPDGLRLGDLIRGPLKIPGVVEWSLNGRRYGRVYQSPEKVLSRIEERLGVKAILDIDEHGIRCGASLSGMVIPTREELDAVSSRKPQDG